MGRFGADTKVNRWFRFVPARAVKPFVGGDLRANRDLVSWATTIDGHHCALHDYKFKRGEVCHRCTTEPQSAADPSTSDGLDRELEAEAAEFKTRGRRMWREANEMLEGTAQDKIQSAKLSSEAVKWERLAIEIKDRLSSRKHLREAMAHELAMSGQRGPN